MNNIKAIVRLAPGQVGFYDELTGIHLTIRKPQGEIKEGLNVSGIKTSVASGRLILVAGSLSDSECIKPVENCKPATPIVKVEKVEEVTKPVEDRIEIVEEIPAPADEVKETEIVEEAVEVIEEVTPKKKTAKKKAATKKED